MRDCDSWTSSPASHLVVSGSNTSSPKQMCAPICSCKQTVRVTEAASSAPQCGKKNLSRAKSLANDALAWPRIVGTCWGTSASAMPTQPLVVV